MFMPEARNDPTNSKTLVLGSVQAQARQGYVFSPLRRVFRPQAWRQRGLSMKSAASMSHWPLIRTAKGSVAQISRDVPVSGRHGDTAKTDTARSNTVPTWPDTVRHSPARRGLVWQIEVRGLADRNDVSGGVWPIEVRGWGPGWPWPHR